MQFIPCLSLSFASVSSIKQKDYLPRKHFLIVGNEGQVTLILCLVRPDFLSELKNILKILCHMYYK